MKFHPKRGSVVTIKSRRGLRGGGSLSEFTLSIKGEKGEDTSPWTRGVKFL